MGLRYAGTKTKELAPLGNIYAPVMAFISGTVYITDDTASGVNNTIAVCDISVMVIAFKICARDIPAELSRQCSGIIITAEHREAGATLPLWFLIRMLRS